MSKRFIETTIWTQNKWFRKLLPKHKLLWFYLLTNCDSVGVWEEDIELASFIIGEDFNINDLLSYGDRLKYFNDKKYWITDFCSFQYGQLKDSPSNKPHQSYISLLKKHSLWIDYTKTIDSLKEKDKEKDMDKEKEEYMPEKKLKSVDELYYPQWETIKTPPASIQDSIKLAHYQANRYTPTTGQLKSQWEIFAKMNLLGDKPYHNENDVYRHFANWFKTQKIGKEIEFKSSPSYD